MHYLRKAGEFSTLMTFISFGIGTLLLLLHKTIGPHIDLFLVGQGYVLVAFVLNLIVFGYLLIYSILHREYREYFAVKMLIMLINLPIAALYIFIATS